MIKEGEFKGEMRTFTMNAYLPWYFNSNAYGKHRDASRNPEATCNSRRCIHLPFGYPIFSKYSKYFRYQKRLEAFASVETPASDVSLRSVNKIYPSIYIRDIYCLLSSSCRYMQNIAYFLPPLLTGLAESQSISITEKIYGSNRGIMDDF